VIQFLLNRVRLSYYFWILFVIFVGVLIFLPTYQFTGAVLTLFSVNSFLYGFYISPILSGQKTRIDELHKVIRSEANALFGLQLKLKKLPTKLRSELQSMVTDYTRARTKGVKSHFAEKEYEALISFCLGYKGENQDDILKILDMLVANQQNRTQFMLQMSNRVYSNEWMIMMILFSITLGIIMFMDIGNLFTMLVVKALLCTGLTMLMIILIKLNTLTHKKAKEIWNPLNKLVKTHFYQID
jgi:hypothetical protein